jgi:sugar/nucleoside kinase (ribokinase family)
MTTTLLVIGGASLDILHFQGRTAHSAGGAGLYTSLAAHRAGVRVTMVGPRPNPMPRELEPAAERIRWVGPQVAPEELPTFEIAHHGAGHTNLENIYWRSEATLSPGDLPLLEPDPDLVYCIGLTDPERQLAFVTHLQSIGRTVACGTYSCAVTDHAPVVREIMGRADIFFCNESEAAGLFGSVEEAHTQPGKALFITRGPRGARVVLGDHATDIPAVPVRELDPTGAGDTFCGTVLAFLALGAHPVIAAEYGVAAAADMITGIGPETLLRDAPTPAPPNDPRVRVDGRQVERIGRLIGSLPAIEPFDFTGELFPPPGHPAALDFFFAATLQQFGFWNEQAGRYRAPMVARLGGIERKGSDYLWAAYRRWLDDQPEGLTPAGQAALDHATLATRTRSDTGPSPLPVLDLRVEAARSFGRDMTAIRWTPASLLEHANASPRPLQILLSSLDHVGGYKEDPLRKKSALLAVILEQRPERFLRGIPGETTPPIVDYHVMRSCLRMGLIRIDDEELLRKLEGRETVPATDERAVRHASYRAMARLQGVSGRSMGAVDYFFFQNRRRCPEMTAPDCGRCPVDPVCGHAIGLFQPVLRTTFY